jgi:hypothetical protein
LVARSCDKKAVFVRTGPTTGLLVEDRQRVANDTSICNAGALVYTVDSWVASGLGPVRVIGGSANGGGFGTLSDAPLHVGERVAVGDVTVAVAGSKGSTLSVEVTLR